MTERGNEDAMQVALNEIARESRKVAADISDAAARGRDTTELAKETNDLMRLHRGVLNAAGSQAHDVMALQFESASQAMLLAKVKVEDQLSEQELAEAIESDLEDEVETQVLGVETRVNKLEKRLDRLDILQGGSASPIDTLRMRQELQNIKNNRKQVIEDIKTRKKRLQDERKSKMKEALQRAKEMRLKIKELRDARKAEKNVTATPTPTPTPPTDEVVE
jgi:hypothetical protein